MSPAPLAEGALTGPGFNEDEKPGPEVGETPADALLARLATLEVAVADAVDRRRPAPDHRDGDADQRRSGQGLFISEDDVGRLLAQPAPVVSPTRPVDHVDGDGAGHPGRPVDRLSELAGIFDLAPLDAAVLLVALAPDVDPRFEKLYAYLHDDVTRHQATVGLCLELCGTSVASPEARSRLRSDAPLVQHRLVRVEEPMLPFPSRVLRVADRVVDHLLGGDLPDDAVSSWLLPPLAVESPHFGPVQAALTAGVGLFYIRAAYGVPDHAQAAGALVGLGLPVLVADLSRLGDKDDALEVAASLAREAGLLRAGLVAGPLDELAGRDARAIDALARAPGPVVLLGARAWDPAWSDVVPLLLEVADPDPAGGGEVWRAVLADDVGDVPDDLIAAASTFRLTPHQVLRAAQVAEAHAAARGGTLDPDAVRAGARAQNGGGLETLARLVRPRAVLDDLVLADPAATQVAEIAMRARTRHRVVGEWDMRGLGASGTGITALFAGPSGTGKTLAAEVIAGTLGLDLYVVDLSSVVDKYVGETEKNLERIFNGAQGVNGVLFFDEADALFGKRSAVSDGHDRYANIEVAYLLQRMEQFDGISLLATNLTANLDDAFARRIDVRVVFPLPEAPERRRLWARHLPPTLPVADDVDLDVLAGAFRFAGGDIANVAVAAAYDAAGREEIVGMVHLMRATAREYRKLGRLCTEEDFGPWFHLTQG